MSRKKRRGGEVFSLAFLDAMTCGLGSIILLYMILTSSAGDDRDDGLLRRRAEAKLLEIEVLTGHENLVELRNTLEEVKRERVTANGLSTRVLEELERIREELATFDESRLAQREHLNKLQTDLKSLDEDVKRLSASRPTPEVPGKKVRAFVGDGDRQYLTGLKVGGDRILILIDGSASMLADTLVNVLRFRNLPPERARRADKWQQAVRTVDWLLTQVPPGSEVQVHVFAETAEPVLPDVGWIAGNDGDKLDEVVARLRERAPSGGTSLHHAFAVAGTLRPDNVILVTDGLPTQGANAPRGRTVTGKQRLKHYEKALSQLPRGVPINTILLAMEGDPMASTKFWQLAIATRGSYMSPTKDWP
ncbi:MAG: vWA domain-containing protein [Acidobacteriota bacterium]